MLFDLEKFISYYEKLKRTKSNKKMFVEIEELELKLMEEIKFSMAKYDGTEVPISFYADAIDKLNINSESKEKLLDSIKSTPFWYK